VRATRALAARTEAEAAEVESREAARRAEMAAGVTRRNLELERDRALHQIEIAEEQRRARAAAELATLEADTVRVEALHRAGLLEQERAHALAMQRLAAESEVRRAQATVEHELRRREAETRDAESQAEAAAQRRLAEIELLLAQSRTLRELVAQAIPQLAAALQPRADTMHYTQIGGAADGGPLAAVPQAVGQVLALAQSFGLELPRR
jgi:hypothetical protein